MSADDTASSRHGEIIIVRRGGHDHEDAHHGGTWKIAFADFMTALMAFFLVMWLTNASDDATKKQIAQYFNPIKLNSAAPPSPGVDPGESVPAPPPVEGSGQSPGATDGKPVGGSEEGGEDQAIFRDPYAVLAEIVAEGGAGVQNGRSEPVLNGTGLPGLNGGDAYRDPFDPSSWQLEPNIRPAEPAADAAEPASGAAPGAKPVASEFATLVEETAPADTSEAEAAPPAAAQAQTPAPAQADEDEAEELEAEIRQSLAGAVPNAAAGLDVQMGEDGLVISLADSLNSGMFEIGSAKPSAETILLVEKVAAILAERPGEIIIRGHTDARPYAGGGDYDNWRLSTARAHMAYYMLLRGGLDETRVDSIEGFADRRLKDAANPTSATNRRIEILLKENPA